MANARFYALKDEFKSLFENLASGRRLMLGEAFQEGGEPPGPKSISSADEARKKTAIIERLIQAGFVDELQNDIKLQGES